MDPKNFLPNAPGSLQYAPGGYWTYHPYALPPLFRWTDRLVSALSAADRALARLEMLLNAAPRNAANVLVRVEAAASCRLAGVQITDRQILYAEAAGAHAPHLLSAPEQLALALVRAYETAGTAPDLPGLRRTHGRILPGAVDERWPPGEFRRGQTWIGAAETGPAAAAFVPPPPEDVLPALESLMAFIDGPAALPDLVRLPLVHYQFSVIHPFYDANGRMTRLLVLWLLHAWGLLPGPALPLSRWLEARRSDAESLLASVSRENAWEDWLVFFLAGIRAESDWSAGLLERMGGLQERLRARLEAERNALRLQQVAELLFASPYITVNQVESALPEGNFKSAARVVDRLVEVGILEEVTGQRRHRVFAASEILRLLDA